MSSWIECISTRTELLLLILLYSIYQKKQQKFKKITQVYRANEILKPKMRKDIILGKQKLKNN